MSWTALVPLKQAGSRKTRLAGCLGPEQRHALSERMALHVLDVLRDCHMIGAVHVLGPDAMPGAGWIRDGGRGLNAELSLAAASLGAVDLLILHADLPLLETEDVRVLLAAAAPGCALATDGRGAGTNALAMRRGVRIDLSFGPDSLRRHRESVRRAGLEPMIIHRAGLSLDIDVPDDLAAAARAGCDLPAATACFPGTAG